MENVNEDFTDEEYREMKKIKLNHSMSWHDIVYYAILEYES